MSPLPTFIAFVYIQNGEWYLEAFYSSLYLLLMMCRCIRTAITMTGRRRRHQSSNTAPNNPLTHPPVNLTPIPLDINPHDIGDVGIDFGVDEG
jgi:hypothetical protein